MRAKFRVRQWLALMAVLALVAAACSSTDSDDAASASSTTAASSSTTAASSSTTAASSSTTAASSSTTAAELEVGSKEQLDALGIGNPSADLCEGRDTITVGYDVFSDTQDYVVAMNGNLDSVAAEIGGCVEFVTLVDNLDPATAMANTQTFIQREVDAVLLFQVVLAAQTGVMGLLDDAGIPAIAHAVPAPGAYFISQSDLEVGTVAGNALLAAVKDRFPGQTPFMVLGNQPTQGEPSENRVDHQADIIREAFPAMTDDQVLFLDTDGSPDDSFTKASNILALLPDDQPILISGMNDDVVGAIFRALEQGGKSDNVLAVGIGGLFPSGIENVCRNEQFLGTVDFAPNTLGLYLVPALLAVVDGVVLPDVITVPVAMITKDDVPEIWPDFDC